MKNINKNESNIPTSKYQRSTSNSAITLVALVITIIILLILAGITLSLTLGDNGIFNKAQISKEKTNYSEAEESLNLMLLDIKTEIISVEKRDTKIKDLDRLKEKEDVEKIEYISEQTSTEITDVENPTHALVTYKGYIFKIDKTLKIISKIDKEEKEEDSKTLGYVEDGLKVLYDGKQNTKSGHNEKSNIWENLIEDEDIKNSMDGQLQNINFTTESGWTENSLILDGINDWVKMGYFYSENMTIEICAKPLDVSIGKGQYYIDNLQNGGISIIKDKRDFNTGDIYTSDYKKVSNDQEIKINQIYSMSTGIDNQKMYFNENEKYTNIKNTIILKGPENDTMFVLGTNPNGTIEDLLEGETRTNMEVYSVRIYDRCLTQEEVKQNYENDKKRFNIKEKPDIKTPEYVTNGLVSLLDAEKNTKYGHSKRTAIWQNLAGTTNASLKNVNNTLESGWTENSLILDGINDWVNVGYYYNSNMTIEIVAEPLNIVDDKTQYFLANVQSGGIGIYKNRKRKNSNEIYVSGYKYIVSENEIIKNKLYSMSTGFNGTEMYFSENGTKYKANYTGSIGNPNSSTVFAIAVDPEGTNDTTGSTEERFNMKVYSVRIYNRCLTEEEIKHNYEIDKARFGIKE